MGNRFDFQSPGAAFVDEMAKILAERKVEARQKMLDEIAQAQEARAQRMTDAQIGNMEFNQGLAGKREMRDELGFLSENLAAGEDVSQLPPDLQEGGRRYNMFRTGSPAPTPFVSTSIDDMQVEGGDHFAPPPGEQGPPPSAAQGAPPPAAPSLVYGGTRQDKLDAEQSQRLGGLVSSMMNSDNPDEKRRGAQLAQLVTAFPQGQAPAELVGRLLNPAQNAFIFDVERGTIKDSGIAIPAGAPLVTQSRPPRPPRGAGMQKVGTTPDGRNIYLDQDGNEVVGTTSTRDEMGVPLGIPAAVYNQHLNSIILMGESDNPSDVNTFRATANNIIANARGVTPQVRQLAQMYIKNPLEATQLMANPKLKLDPREKQQLELLLNTVSAQQFMNKLVQTAPQKPQPTIKEEQPQAQGPGFSSGTRGF